MRSFKIRSIGFKHITFSYLQKKGGLRWTTIRLWAWLYNLCNIIIDAFALKEGQVMLRVPMAKNAVTFATGETDKHGKPFAEKKDLESIAEFLKKQGYTITKVSKDQIKVFTKDN